MCMIKKKFYLFNNVMNVANKFIFLIENILLYTKFYCQSRLHTETHCEYTFCKCIVLSSINPVKASASHTEIILAI
jgi:hypothetical protein